MALTITGSLTVSGSLKTGMSNVDDSIIFALDPSNLRCYTSGSTHIYDLIRHRKNSSLFQIKLSARQGVIDPLPALYIGAHWLSVQRFYIFFRD